VEIIKVVNKSTTTCGEGLLNQEIEDMAELGRRIMIAGDIRIVIAAIGGITKEEIMNLVEDMLHQDAMMRTHAVLQHCLVMMICTKRYEDENEPM